MDRVHRHFLIQMEMRWQSETEPEQQQQQQQKKVEVMHLLMHINYYLFSVHWLRMEQIGREAKRCGSLALYGWINAHWCYDRTLWFGFKP